MAFDQSLNLELTPQTPFRKIKNFFKKLFGFVTTDTAEYIHGTAETVWLDLVEATPWYSGAAANSWTLSVGPTEPVDKAFSGKGKDAFSPPQLPRVPVIPIDNKGNMKGNYHIQNGVPYIELLNAGWSLQASPGWIEETVQNTINERFR